MNITPFTILGVPLGVLSVIFGLANQSTHQQKKSDDDPSRSLNRQPVHAFDFSQCTATPTKVMEPCKHYFSSIHRLNSSLDL